MAKPGSGTRLEKLLDLIECGSCQENRFAAGDQIISILASHPEQVPDVLQAVSTRLASPHWDARVAAARCLGAAARRFPGWTPQAMARSIGVQDAAYVELLQESWASDEDDAPLLPGFDVAELLQRAPPLVASSGEEFAASAAAGGLAAQRSALRQKLGLGGALGNLVDDRELAPDAEMARVPSARLRLAASRRQKRHGGAQQGGDAKRRTLSADDEAPSAGAESISLSALRSELAAAAEVFGPVAGGEEGWAAVQAGEWALQRVWTATVPGLLSPRWETRHGAAAALRDVLREAAGAAGVVAPVAPAAGWWPAGPGARRSRPGPRPPDVRAALPGGDRALARCAARCWPRSRSTASPTLWATPRWARSGRRPRRRSARCAPALPPPRLAAALRALRALARCDVWQARHGALLGVRYAVGALPGAGSGADGAGAQGRITPLSTGPGSPRGLCELLLQTFLEALADADDDVRSAAADALALLAPHLEPTEAAAAWDRVLVLLPGLDALSPAAGPFLSLARALATGPGGGARARREGGERTATTTDESCAAVEEISACLLALAPRLALEPRASEDRLVARVETLWRRLVDAGNWSLRSGTEEVQLDDDQASPPAWVSDAIAALWKAGLAGPGGRPGAGVEALPPSDFEELVPGRLACGRAFGYLAESLEKRHASGASLRAAQASLRDAFAHHLSAHRPARVLVAAAALLAWSERGASAAAAEVAAAAAATLGEAPAPPLGVSAALNPYIQPLMAALRREPCEPLQRLAARGVAHLVVELGDKGPGDKILKNLVGFACTEPAGEPLTLEQILDSGELAMSGRRAPAAAPAAGKGKDGAAAAAAAAASAAATEVTRRGGEAALVALCQVAGDTLFDGAAPGLLEVHVVAPLRAALAAKDAEPESLRPVGQGAVAAARVVETLAPCLTDGRWRASSPAAPPTRCPRCGSCLARCRSRRSRRSWPRRARSPPWRAARRRACSAPRSRTASRASTRWTRRRARGGLVLIACVLQALGPAVIPYLPLVARPLLGRMSDGQADLRRLAAACFAAVVAVLPLSTPTVEAEKKEAGFLDRLMGGAGAALESDDETQSLNPDEAARRAPGGATLALAPRPYQRQGMAWLDFLRCAGLHGILADDMGLGKTLQATAAVAAAHRDEAAASSREARAARPSLVLCPSTLVAHWAYEIGKNLAPESALRVLPYAGSPAEKAAIAARLQAADGAFDVAVASYESLRADSAVFTAIDWLYVVADEGHVLGGGSARLAAAARALRCQHRLLLTGTPVQNGTGVLALEALHRAVAPFVLRRTKGQVLSDLPPKILQDIRCTPTPLQRYLLARIQDAVGGDAQVVEKRSAPSAVASLVAMRKLCTHPALLLEGGAIQMDEAARAAVRGALPREGAGVAATREAELAALRADLAQAPKLAALAELLREAGLGRKGGAEGRDVEVACGDAEDGVAAKTGSRRASTPDNGSPITSPDDANDDRDDAGHRVLIFAQLRGSLDLVESLVLRPLGIASVRIDGAVDAGERFRRAQRFNADPTLGAMLLTTGVGGLGLNLTAADTVVFLEHDWNPSRDLQAMDRAHRLGQRRAVNVYRLLLESTIEEEIMGLQAFKTQVARAVIGADGAAGATPGGAGALDAVGAAARRALEDRAPAPAPKPGLAGMLAELQDLDQVDEQYASQFGNSG
ncbi:hypothetical protein QBZ16_000861 [Prototheca wickerhamii]|uniref:Uncharacterized protein n=1 Tax=Prototheca wickerhamii TaxID=3111 RepID=A0AAD9MM44_PROWI|nr:hypothetical protein QBZ16_000861 [Prototheca wickerhamii]